MRILAIPTQGPLAPYQYAGLDRTVKLTYVIPEIDLSYISPDGAPGGDAGDPYTGWDRFGRTQDLRWSKGEDLLDQTRYGYNRYSQRTWREAPLATSGNDEAYQYDGLYQITGRQRGDLNTNHTAIGGIPVRAESFDYDPIGNWKNYEVSVDGTLALDQSRVHDQANTLTQIDASSALLAHDAAGNMTLCPPPADGDWDEALTLVWDVWNRLTEVRSADGTTLIAKYTYDGLWRRTTRQIGSGPVIHTYYNAQWRPLQETEQTGETTTLARTYDWGLRYRDDLIRRINHLHDDATHYALHDYYNVTAIVGCTGGSSSRSESHADASIAVLERYGYSAFGDVRFMTAAYVTKPASDHAWDLLYKAQFRDIETGFYNYGFRYYSPMLGRWLSRDPIGERGGLNLYGFCYNDPYYWYDYLGFFPEMNGQGRVNLSRKEFERNYEDRGLALTDRQKRALSRGCIGLALCKLDREMGLPENSSNTTCWLKESEADDQKCPPNTRKVVFSKQGRYRNNEVPKKYNDGSIPKNSVEGFGDDKNVFNYVTRYPTSDGFRYGWMNHHFLAGDQFMYFDNEAPEFDRYPDVMWCVTCVLCKGSDGSEK